MSYQPTLYLQFFGALRANWAEEQAKEALQKTGDLAEAISDFSE